ncbi:BTAD domain-containing putative transcriptional regulator [Actinophytocola xanthii]|uniref:BTAD domain-containing putative transcriptional regulator n=1 Tax=Actinophytocola xanthii TaxID=1912961 RepID=UPI001E30C0E7|nr:BTAD domain-containing putative transcriptional regulator [Actinophytocola xanthii]
MLGPLAMTHAGVSVPLTGGRRRRLLAALLVNANAVVPADRLIDILWGADAPDTAPRNLHNQVWRLRAALEDSGGAALVTEPPGYLLRVEPSAIDAVRFEAALSDAAAERLARPERAVERLTTALQLWRGPAYAEFADEEFCRYEAIRLAELRLVAVEERFAAGMDLGRYAELVGELDAFAVEHPLRERATELLMTALHRSGRQADATEVYLRFRRHLVEHLGVEPSPALRRHHEHLLRADPVPPAASWPAGATREQVGNLRSELSELVGRAADVEAARRTLARARVVTLTGTGGVGKTRLATGVAAALRADFPHGVWVCELAAVRDGWLVPDVLATTLGVRESRGADVTDGLVDFLRSRRALLVVDNCEHVLDAAAGLVTALARGCPELTVLVTSREPLGIEGEHVLPVRPLAVPPPAAGQDPALVARIPSVELFTDRARAALPTFALGEHNVAAVVEICRGLDGLPLAIELAATRLRSMSLDEIGDRLERRLEFLHSPRRTREARHSTLGAVVAWSYDLLSPREQAVFDALSVLVGSFTLDDAVAVAADEELGPAEVVDVVTDLVHKSMLVADTDRAPTRYTVLETLRIFGRERLTRTGRLEALLGRHTALCLAVAEGSASGLVGPDEAAWAERVTGLLDDLRGAHTRALAAEPEIAVRLSAALLRFTSTHGPSELYGWADRAVGAASGSPGPRLAAALAVAAAGAARSGDLVAATDLARRGLDAVPVRDDPARRFPLWVLARVASFEDRLADAAHLYAVVAELAGRAGDDQCAAYVTASGALQHAYLGATAHAVSVARRAKKLAMATRNPTAIAWADCVLGVALRDSDPERALAILERANEVGRACGNAYIPGAALSASAAVTTRHDDPYRAARLVLETIGYWSRQNHRVQRWGVLRTAVILLTRFGDDVAAATLHGAVTASGAAVRPTGVDAELLEAAVAGIAERLGTERFAAATAHGAALPEEDVVALARVAVDRAPAGRLHVVRPLRQPLPRSLPG